MNKESKWLLIPDTDIYITEETRQSFISRLSRGEEIRIEPNNKNYSEYTIYCSSGDFIYNLLFTTSASYEMKNFFKISNLCFKKWGWV